LTIADADKPEIFPIVSRLTQLGYEILATGGTAAALRAAGFSPREVGKIGEPSPNVLDVIVDGTVDLVINTMSSNSDVRRQGFPVMKDGFEIRRTAVERRIPCLTSLDTAAALVESAATAAGDLEVRTLTEWREGISSPGSGERRPEGAEEGRSAAPEPVSDAAFAAPREPAS
jgi:carbamoyl-phosphate synthase large subunit